jgi:hypothetical protein
MIKLFNILSETVYQKKDSAKKSFKTFDIKVIVKTDKKINRNEVEERIRGIEGVTIVKSIESQRLDNLSKKNTKYNYDLYDIKFVTNSDPKTKIDAIKDDILHSDDNSVKIRGVASISPDYESIEKV